MKKVVVSVFLAIFALSALVFAQAREEYAPMRGSLELGLVGGKAVLKVLSEVTFADHLVSDEIWAKMSEKEKKGGYVNVYYYKYTFTNAGTIKLRFTFANYEALRSPLFQFIQDFSIVLEPGQSKTIHFTANTAPQVIEAGCALMAWFPEKNRWFSIGGGGQGLYVPRWNAIAEENPF